MRNNPVKAALKEGQVQVGTWLSLASPLAARYLARTGFHWINLDIEHSPASWETAALIFGAIADAGGVPLARIPSITQDRKSTRLNSSHVVTSRMPSSA